MEINDQVLSHIIDKLYNKGDYQTFVLEAFLKTQSPQIHHRDIKIIQDKLLETNFAEYDTVYKVNPIHGEFENMRTGKIRLTDEGIILLKRHSTYLGYLQHNELQAKIAERKTRIKRNWERFERIPKVFWPLTGVGVVLVALIPYLIPLIYKNDKSPSQQTIIEKGELKSDTIKVHVPK